MSSLHQALALQGLLEEVGERIKDNSQGRSYLRPDGRAYVLAVGGDRAKAMEDFMTAVGQYLRKMQSGRTDPEIAKAEVLRAFEEWLSRQQL
jgi:hypothetical protein